MIISSIIAPFGETLLELAILASCAQFLLVFRPKSAYQPSLALCNAALLGLSFAALIYGFANSDFGLELVVANSHTQKPILYKITATWGNHEGSMLLWCLILSLYGAHMAVRLRMGAKHRITALGVMGLVQMLFIGYLRIFSNPFAEIFPPAMQGQGFNPLLQDFGLAIHPPILYAGYVGFAAPFAIAIAVLWRGGNQSFANILHPYIMFAWAMLTAGIALGSWWAYRELGWGGWWFWDPVENVALLPWLCGTALFHANLVLRKTDNMLRYVLLLAISCFALSLVGTFLVRSGLLSSVHSFASDPTRGVAICAIMAIVISIGIAAYLRGAANFIVAKPCKLFSKQSLILVNNLLLLLATAMILLATFYPFIIEAISDRRITIGADYFTQIFAYLMLPLVIACALSNFLTWDNNNIFLPLLPSPPAPLPEGEGSKTNLLDNIFTTQSEELPSPPGRGVGGEGKRDCGEGNQVSEGGRSNYKSWIIIAESAIITSIACWFLPQPSIMLVAGLFCGVALLLATLKIAIARIYRRKLSIHQVPMLLGHAGLGLFVLCATLFGAYHQSAEFVMQKGDVRTAFGAYQLSLNNVEFGAFENYLWQKGDVRIMRNNQELQFTPEERYYETEGQFTTEAAIKHFLTHDLYITMKRINNSDKTIEIMQQKYMIYVYYNPAMSFLWLSVAMIAIAGIISSIKLVRPTGVKNKL